MDIQYEVRIPRDRIAVLIGIKGQIKRKIEQDTSTRLNIDSQEGDVAILGKDALDVNVSKDIVRAIGRGFNPEFAFELLKPDYFFESIDISEVSSKKNASINRIKSRLIGKEGGARRTIEKLTNTHICVYGKTISIIGYVSNVDAARKAVTSLIRGAPHSSVYATLERTMKNNRVLETNIEDAE